MRSGAENLIIWPWSGHNVCVLKFMRYGQGPIAHIRWQFMSIFTINASSLAHTHSDRSRNWRPPSPFLLSIYPSIQSRWNGMKQASCVLFVRTDIEWNCRAKSLLERISKFQNGWCQVSEIALPLLLLPRYCANCLPNVIERSFAWSLACLIRS